MEKDPGFFERLNNWIRQSVSLKLMTITLLALLLLIPASMIKSVIAEREMLSEQAIGEVSNKWAGAQQINGPVLCLPLIYEYPGKDGERIQQTDYFFLLPDSLQISGALNPKKLRRGIYEVVVYRSGLTLSGSFQIKDPPTQAELKEVRWDQAFLTLGLSDLRGIEEQLQLNWGGERLAAEPGSRITELVYSGVTFPLPPIRRDDTASINFMLDLKLQGSRELSFVPLGNTTVVQMSSDWPSPSFKGNFLPDQRQVTEQGFSARWKVLQLNRNFPQSWIGDPPTQKIQQSSFGLDLILPMDDYQKAMRSAKYAVMTIALTFIVFFLVEVLNGRKIHPFQYTLVGLALCLFYILLVSISEHTHFNFAYGIAATAVIGMITLYSLTIFRQLRLSALLSGILLALFGFVFVTLQLADYALLLGSLGLLLILGAIMFFTRKVNWYELQRTAD